MCQSSTHSTTGTERGCWSKRNNSADLKEVGRENAGCRRRERSRGKLEMWGKEDVWPTHRGSTVWTMSTVCHNSLLVKLCCPLKVTACKIRAVCRLQCVTMHVQNGPCVCVSRLLVKPWSPLKTDQGIGWAVVAGSGYHGVEEEENGGAVRWEAWRGDRRQLPGRMDYHTWVKALLVHMHTGRSGAVR